MISSDGDYRIAGTGVTRTIAEIVAYSERERIAIPDDLVWFLSHAANGGRPDPRSEFPISDLVGDDRMSLHGLIGVDTGKKNNELANVLAYPPVERMLPRAFPFGYDDLGGYLLLVTEDPHRGEIRYSPDDEFANPDVEPNLYFVAPSIREFVRMIQHFQATGSWT